MVRRSTASPPSQSCREVAVPPQRRYAYRTTPFATEAIGTSAATPRRTTSALSPAWRGRILGLSWVVAFHSVWRQPSPLIRTRRQVPLRSRRAPRFVRRQATRCSDVLNQVIGGRMTCGTTGVEGRFLLREPVVVPPAGPRSSFLVSVVTAPRVGLPSWRAGGHAEGEVSPPARHPSWGHCGQASSGRFVRHRWGRSSGGGPVPEARPAA
jgi:hypothetical protein